MGKGILFALLLASAAQAQTPCQTAGLKLPNGFCATVFADVPGARHLVVAPNGDVFVAVAGRTTGGVVALRDTTHDGVADMRLKFGNAVGAGIAMHGENLYFATNTGVLRFHVLPGNLLAATQIDTIVSGLPAGGHTFKTIALGRGNQLFVNLGSRTNSCQVKDREANSPGVDPCTELLTRAGIWRFDANRKNQTPKDGKRYATGLRNTVALTVGPDGAVYGAQHGRDQLSQNWGQYFSNAESAEKPAEIFFRANEGDDFGWPYCFFDREQNKHVLAPEYGGDGKKVGRCSSAKLPLTAFPGHWAPDGLTFYTGRMFPESYRGGVFLAFHGSWNRAPEPQAGYKVVFLPMRGGAVSGEAVTFADGFAGPRTEALPGGAEHRPVGVAVAPDGALFISDDQGGRIWRVTYSGK